MPIQRGEQVGKAMWREVVTGFRREAELQNAKVSSKHNGKVEKLGACLESQTGAFLDEAMLCPAEHNILPYKRVAARGLHTACMGDSLLTADG